MVKVSILCPAYNSERFILDALESIIKQDFSDYEVIVVDDASTDKTAEIIQTYVDKYPDKIKLMKHEVNKGQAGALNSGLAQSRGKYLVTLDADDTLVVPYSLRVRTEYLDSHPDTSMIYGNGFYMSENGQELTDYNSFEYDPQMLHRFNPIPNGSVMIKRLAVIDAGGFDESLRTCQDYDLWLRVQSKGFKIEKIPDRIFNYRQHISQKGRTKLLNETLKKIHDKYKHIVVSIVVPVYNCDRFLVGCLDSIKAQRCGEVYDINQTFEVIIVDDASTDKTAEIAQEYVKKDDRFRYVKNEENMGIGYSRNRGIDEAKGDMICFLSADDEFLPDYVLGMIKSNQVYPDSILYSDYVLFDEMGNIIGQANTPQTPDVNATKVLAIAQAEYNKMFICYNCFASAKVWRENRFDPEFRMGEDLEHMLRVYLTTNIWFICVNAPLFKYRVGNSTTSARKQFQIPENNKKIKKKINELTGRRIFEV